MAETEPDEPFIRFPAGSAMQKSAEAIAAMTDDEFDEYMADLFEDFPDDETDIEEALRQGEADIEAGRVRPLRDVIADLNARFGLGLDAELDEPEPSHEEQIAKLRRGMADFEAGRYRPARDVMREIAAEHGFDVAELASGQMPRAES